MVYIDKKTVPHCYVEEKKFEWGEPYTISIPIFNLSVNPELSNIEFTIEVLGKNNFKNNLGKLYNILINKEEKHRINNLNEPILNREFLVKKIIDFIDENINNIAPWENEFTSAAEEFYLEWIEDDLKRELLFEKKIY
ncbi:hypothetical protein LNQ49_22560 [Flavobacterium sp. F-65]|jgi:hypothetical protein|uniref:Immunity protein 8 n=1 Tax=Flavobacterium pisciphilum TaxID=2893755 RepID=A0ABS8N029_9FLAO|nr:hypothetical protein [Flavobacterium sp. F-65]MCC9074380.1 hypothetical protein [Flavobacterium sp. F-65]